METQPPNEIKVFITYLIKRPFVEIKNFILRGIRKPTNWLVFASVSFALQSVFLGVGKLDSLMWLFVYIVLLTWYYWERGEWRHEINEPK